MNGIKGIILSVLGYGRAMIFKVLYVRGCAKRFPVIAGIYSSFGYEFLIPQTLSERPLYSFFIG